MTVHGRLNNPPFACRQLFVEHRSSTAHSFLTDRVLLETETVISPFTQKKLKKK